MPGQVSNGFKIPVSFEALQSSITDLQKILDGLQPNTKQWKELSRIINTMTSEASKLQAQMSMPFTSQKQFNSAEKTIDKLEQTAARVSIVMNSLKFSDIKLTPEQTNEFKKFEEEIKAIQASYKQLQETVKQQLISSGNNAKLLTGIDKNALTKDFDEIQSIVENQVKELEEKVQKQQDIFNGLKSNIEQGNRATALTTTGKGLTREALGDSIFDKYLQELSGGGVKLKLGKGISKQALLTEIEEMFHLEPGQLQHLASKTIDEINKAFQDYGAKGNTNIFKGFIDRQKKAVKDLPLVSENKANLEQQLKEYRALQDELQRLQTSSNMGQASADAAAKIEQVQGRIQALQTSIANGVSANSNYGNSLRQLGSQFGQMRSQLEAVNTAFLRQQSVMNSFNSMKMMITNFMGFTQVLNLTKRAIKEAANHIKELDTVMNQISIVTDMDTSDLWGQVESYSSMAQKYGASIKGAYEVSKIYYQQGLDTKDVLTLTNETLKLAKISGMDYAATTDYMTTAIRGFKMEMQDASVVVDVYSNLASNTAVSQEELAVAMSKTASSMESVGATFEETSAMIATMVAVTRESATNIGSAMKSIASRYGELTKNPASLLDSEGEAMSFNKVDTALQSVGISMKTVNGQFREFTDVILELGEKWDQLESTQQRYIATQFAGNRQQSRFLALVSNVDLLKENIYNAENSEDIGTTQALKALDSLESKIEQVRVAYQQFYTTIGIESVWKGFLDQIKNVINNLNGMPKLFGKLPIAAVSAIMLIVNAIKNVGLTALTVVAKQIGPIFSNGINATKNEAKAAGEGWFNSLNQAILNKLGVAQNTGKQISMAYAQGVNAGYINQGAAISQNQYDRWGKVLTGQGAFGNIDQTKRSNLVANAMLKSGAITQSGAAVMQGGGAEALALYSALAPLIKQTGDNAGQAQGKLAAMYQAHAKGLATLQNVGAALQFVALSINATSTGGKVLKGVLTAVAGVITLVGIAATITRDTLNSIPWVAVASAIIAVISGIVQAIDAVIHDLDNQVETATKKAEELSNKAKELKADYKTVDSSVKKMKELEQTRYDSAEAAREYQDAVNELAETYPILIESVLANGDVVLRTAEIENVLTEARKAAADAAWEAARAEGEKARLEQKKAKNDLHTANDKLQDIFIEDRGVFKIGSLSSMRIKGETSYNQVLEVQKYLDAIEAASEGEVDPDEIIKQYESLMEYLGQNKLELSKELSEALSPIISKAREYNSYGAGVEVANRNLVTSYMNKQYGGNENSIFTKNQGLWAAATQRLYKLGELDGTEQAFAEEKLTAYRQQALDPLDKWWTNMGHYAQTEMEKMLSNSDNYSKSDVEARAKELGIIFNETNDWILDTFTDTGEYASRLIEKSKNNIKGLNASTNFEAAVKYNSAFNEITLPEFNLLSAIIDQASSLEDLGIDANDFVKQAMSVYQDVVKLPAELRNQVIDQFINNGITKEGLTRTLQYIEDNDEISAAMSKVTHTDSWGNLETLIKNSRNNLLLTVNTVTDTFKNDWEDIDKFISKLTSGFDQSSLDDILTEAQKYGIDPKQLEKMLGLENGKYKLGTENIDNVYSQVTTFYSKSMDGIKSDVEEAFGRIENIKFDETKIIPKERVEDYQTVLGGRFTEFFEQDQEKNWQLRAEKAEEDLYTALGEEATKVTSGVDNFTKMLEQWAATQTQLSHWKAGDYSSFVDTGLFEKVEEAYDRIRQVSRGAQKTSKEKDNKDFNDAVTTYASGWSKLSSDLAAFGLDYVNKHLSEYEGINWAQETDVSQVDGTITESEISLAQIAAKNAGKTVKEINAAVGAAITKKHAPATQPKALANLLSGGFTADEFTAYMADYAPDGTDILQFFNETTGEFADAFEGLFEWDEETGNIRIAAGKSIKEVNDAFIKATGKGLDEGSRLYASLIDEATKDAIADADFKDVHKKNAAVLSELSKATVGSRIAVTGLSEDMKTKLKEAGFEFTGDYIEITSQNALNSLMNALTTLRSDSSLDPQESKVLEGLEKYLKPTTLSNVISETVSKEAAEAWAIASSAESAEKAMKDLGYTWSDAANAYVQDLDASTDTIASIQEQIDALDFGNDPQAQQKKNELQTKLNKLKSHKGSQQYSALSNIISNYQAVSDDAIQALADSLNLPLEKVKQYFSANANGTYTADISSIITDINNGILDIENGVLALLGNTIGGMLSSVLSSLEDSIDGNISGSYSEMAGKALAIYTKMSKEEQDALGNDFTNLIEFDITTGQSKLTDTAIAAQQQQIFDQMYSDQNTILEAKQAYADWLKQQRDAGIKYANADIALSEFIKTNEDYSFLSQYSTDVSTWHAHINKGDDRVVDYLIGQEQKAISDAMNKHVASMAKESLAAFDFNGIFDESANKDKNKDTLKTLLTNLGIDPNTLTDRAMETIYGDLLRGSFDALNNILPEGTKIDNILSSEKQTEFMKAHDAALETTLDELLTKDVDTYSEATQAILEALGLKGKTTQEKVTSVQSILDSSKFTTQAEKASRAQEIAQATGAKRAENLLELLSGGFTDDEFEQWVNENFLPEDREVQRQKLGTANISKTNDRYTVRSGITVQDILKDFGVDVTELNYTDEKLKQIEADWSTAVASEANELNAEVRAVKQINDILSGSLGEQISVADLGLGDIDIADVEKTGNEIKINSEAGRKALIEWIASKKDSYKDQQQVFNAINAAEQEMWSKYDHATAYEQLSSGLIDRDVADTIKLTLATADEMSMSTNEFMEQFGYKWSDEYHKFYVETADQLSKATDRIKTDKALNDSSKNAALASIEGLKQDHDEAYQQYTKISEAIGKSLTSSDQLYHDLADLNITDEYFEDDGDFGKKLNIGKLLRDRKKLGISDIVFKALGDNFASFYDDITGTLSKATEYALSGTQSESDKQAFIEQAASLGMEITESDFVYNDLVKGWVLDINKLAEFRDIALSQMVGKDSETVNTYGKLLTTEAAKEKIDIKSFLGSDNRNVGSFAYRALEKQLTDYYTLSDQFNEVPISSYMPTDVQARIREYNATRGERLEKAVASDIEALEKGGAEAIAVIEKLTADGMEMSPEEIASYFKPQADRYEGYLDKISQLSMGSYVAAGDLRNILQTAGVVDANGIVVNTDNMVTAYKAIYDKLSGQSATIYSTLAQRNKAYVTYLKADRQKNGDILSTLQSGGVMDLDQLESLANKYITDKDLGQITNPAEYGYSINKWGQVVIDNWQTFSEKVFGEIADTTDADYIAAYKAFNEGKIQRDNQIKDMITSEVEAIKGAKVGDKIDISGTISKYGDSIFDGLNVSIVDGILEIHDAMQLPQIATQVLSAAVKAGDILESELLDFIASIQDGIIDGIKSATDLNVSGTDSFAGIQSFITEFNNTVSGSVIDASAFYYDTFSKTFKLDSGTLKKYVEAKTKELESYGLSDAAIQQYINDQTEGLQRSSIDVAALLEAEGKDERNKIATSLAEQIKGLDNYHDIAQKAATLLGKTDEEIRDANVEHILQVLMNGGIAAVEIIKDIKGDEVTSADISAAYSANIERMRTTLNEISLQAGNVVSEYTAVILNSVGITTTDLGNGTAIINQQDTDIDVDDLVNAYITLYGALKSSNESTIEDLNNAFAKMLETSESKETAALEALQNAAAMTWTQLGELLSKQGKQLSDIYGDLESYGIEQIGAGKVRIFDFFAFAQEMGYEYGSREFTSALKTYNQGLISYDKEVSSNIRDEINSLLSAKPGDQVDLTYLWDAYGEDTINEILAQYGASIHNGLLTLEQNADITGIITSLGQLAAAAGDMIPSELAELEDAIAELLSKITDLISKGFKGELNNADKQTVTEWAELHNLDISWQKTANGWKIAESSIWDCYNAVNDLNIAEGEVLRTQIKQSKIEHDDRYADSQRTAAHIKDLEDELQYEEQLQEVYEAKASNQEIPVFARLNGNVDMKNRPHVQNSDGSYSTILGTEYLSQQLGEQEVHVLMTPIPEWAKVEDDYLSDAQLDEYFNALMAKHPVDVQALLELDKQGLEIDGKHFSNLMIDVQDAAKVTEGEFKNMALEAHNASAAWEDLRGIDEAPDNSERIAGLKEELALAREINAERATSKDDSFDFMNNKIPAGQENPLTYAKNLTKAFKAINDAYKVKNTYDLNGGGVKRTRTGYMGYEDFYNIVNELNNMAAVSGHAIQIGHTIEGNAYELDGTLESASNFITEGIKTLTSVDSGEMMVNIGALGINLANGGKELQNGIKDGVDAVADAEIAAIDAMIAVLEVIVAMEKLKEIDADQDMTIDLGEMFKFKIPDDPTSEIIDFTDKYDEIRKWLLDQMQKNKDLQKAMNEFKFGINGKTMSMAEWLNLSFKELGLDPDGLRAYNKAISAFYTAAMSNDYDLDKVAESVKQVLIDSGVTDLEVDIGDYSLIIKGGNISVVDWRTGGAQDAIKAFLAHNGLKDTEENRKKAQSKIQTAISNYTEGKHLDEISLEYVLRVNNRLVVDDDGNVTGVTYDGHTYSKSDTDKFKRAIAMNYIKDRGILDPNRKDITDVQLEGNVATYNYKVGSKNVEFKITYDDQGGIESANYNVDGTEYSSIQEAQDKGYESMLKKIVEAGAATDIDDAKTKLSKDVYLYQEWNIRTKTELKFEKDGKTIDINNFTGAEARKELANLTPDMLADIAKVNGETGNIDVTLPNTGVTFTVPGKGIAIEADGKDTGAIDTSALLSYIQQNLLGQDLGLQENITAAITTAFQNLSNIDPSNLSEAASAMGNLATQAGALANVDWDKIIKGMNGINPPEGNLPNAPGDNSTKGSSNPAPTKDSMPTLDEIIKSGRILGSAGASDVGGFGRGKAPTIPLGSVTGTAQTLAIQPAKAVVDEDLAKHIEDIPTVEAPVDEITLNVQSFENLKTVGTEAGNAVAEGFTESIEEMPNQLEKVLGSVREHFNTLVEDVKTAISTIKDELHSIQEHASITWTITANDGSGNENSLINQLFNGNLGSASNSGGAESAGLEVPEIPINIAIKIEEVQDSIEKLQELLEELANTPYEIQIKANIEEVITKLEQIKTELTDLTQSTHDVEIKLVDIEMVIMHLEEVATLLESIGSSTTDIKINDEGILKASGELDTLKGKMTPESATYTITVNADPIPAPPSDASATYTITVKTIGGGGGGLPTVNKPGATGSKNLPGTRTLSTCATGNFGLAKSKGTLMGELGPELVVSNGRYFVAGQDGAEMVNLDKDAIVFNHLQTEQLLKNGMSAGRGRAVTNERNAVAFATGNINGGPAMASAAQALATLKQLRAMWQALKGASISDLAGAGGGGGGGGGGGNEDKAVDPKEWVALVERWYNLMQKIAVLEHQITHEEQLRSTIQSAWNKNGTAYAKSQVKSLNALREQMQLQEQLNISRADYYDKRREALKSSALGQIIEFDENGQMLFKKDLDPSKFDGFTDAMEWRTWLTGYDEDHKARFSSKQKYEKLRAAGLIPDHVYDSNGKEITMDSDQDGEVTDQEKEDYYYNVTKQVFDNMDEYQEAQQSLYDSIQEGQVTFLELQEQYNELLNEMYENQMDLEEKVLDAIENLKQREIDELQDTRDALEESVDKYINGLSDALNKERDMYDNQEAQDDLNRKRRQLGILERSGGSATDIKALQDEIQSLERDQYFDLQQQQIDAIREASDLQIERMDQQIDIMTQSLEYQKAYGLLWGEVYTVMGEDATTIAQFIAGHNPEFWESSPLHSDQMMNDYLFGAQQWQEFRKNTDEYGKALIGLYNYTINQAWEDFDKSAKNTYGATYNEERKKKAREIYEAEFKESNDATAAAEKARLYLTGEQIIDKRKEEITGYGKTYEVGDKSDHWEYSQIKGDDKNHHAHHYKDGIYTGETKKEAHTWSGETCSKCGYAKPKPQASSGGGGGGGGGGSSCAYCGDKCVTSCTQHCASSCWSSGAGSTVSGKGCSDCTGTCHTGCKGGCKITATAPVKAASGGFVSHGTYELGERGIETVLTAEQTKVLRNNILSNRPSSLISLLKTYNEGFSNMSNPFNTQPTTEDNSTNIDKIELTMNVQQMSNDYDARRAGQEMMNEVMRIARKTNAANSIRR